MLLEAGGGESRAVGSAVAEQRASAVSDWENFWFLWLCGRWCAVGEEEGDGSSNVKEKGKGRTEEAKEKEGGGFDVKAERKGKMLG